MASGDKGMGKSLTGKLEKVINKSISKTIHNQTASRERHFELIQFFSLST